MYIITDIQTIEDKELNYKIKELLLYLRRCKSLRKSLPEKTMTKEWERVRSLQRGVDKYYNSLIDLVEGRFSSRDIAKYFYLRPAVVNTLEEIKIIYEKLYNNKINYGS